MEIWAQEQAAEAAVLYGEDSAAFLITAAAEPAGIGTTNLFPRYYRKFFVEQIECSKNDRVGYKELSGRSYSEIL